MSVYAETGIGIFGLALERSPSSDGAQVLPGAILLKGKDHIGVIQPSPRDPVYFSALVLWAHFAGPEAARVVRDTRLPMFTRDALASLPRLDAYYEGNVAPKGSLLGLIVGNLFNK